MVVSLQSFTLLSEDGDSSQRLDKEAALAKAVDASALNMNNTTAATAAADVDSPKGGHEKKTRSQDDTCDIMESSALLPLEKQTASGLVIATFEQPLEEANVLSFERKVAVLYTLVAACVADTTEPDKEGCSLRQGYDARHRVALRLLAVWLGVKWNEMVCVLGTHACISNTIWYYMYVKLVMCESYMLAIVMCESS